MRKMVWVWLALVVIAGCGQGATEGRVEGSIASPVMAKREMAAEDRRQLMAASMAPQSAPSAAVDGGNSIATLPNILNRSVIRTGTLTVRVKNVEKAERSTSLLTSRVGGYVQGSQSSDLSGENPSITLELRVPVRQFEAIIEQCEALGVRQAKTVSSQDVSGQLIDLDARVKALRAEETSYLAMLGKATNLNSVIQLRTHVTELRSMIESIEGQRKDLGNQAAMSSLSLTLQQESIPLATTHKDDQWLALTWTDATNRLFVFGKGVVSVGIYALLFSPFAVILGWFVWRLTRRTTSVRLGA